MANWVQRSITRTLLGSSPSRWFKAYSGIVGDVSRARVWAYNGGYDSALTNVDIYDNALFELNVASGVDTEVQRNRSNWDHGASGNNVVQLSADLTTPTPIDRHSTYDLADDGYLYYFIGLSTNPGCTKDFAASTIDVTNNWVDLTMNCTPFYTGSIVRLTTTGNFTSSGLATGTTYWIIRHNSTRVGFATSYANARAGTAIDITGQGSGTHTMTLQTNSGIGNHPSDTWRCKVSSGGAQYGWEQLFPTGEIPYHVPGQAAPTSACKWFPDLSAFVIMNLNTDGYTYGNRTTWLYYPASNTFERLASYTNNAGGPQSGSPQCMAYDPDTDGGCIWFFGGEGAGNALWKFKSDKTWTEITESNSPPSTRVNHGVVFANGKLYVQGGESADGGTNRNDFWEYDPVTNAWTQNVTDSLPTSANYTYMAFDGTYLVVMNNALETWTWEVPAEANGDLSGTSSATTGAIGNLTGVGGLSGAASATGAASGVVSGAGALSGTASATTSASGTLNGSGSLSGTASAIGAASGVLNNNVSGALAGTASAVAAGSGTLSGQGALSGSASASTSAQGLLAGVGFLSGLASALGSGTGQIYDLNNPSVAIVGIVLSQYSPAYITLNSPVPHRIEVNSQ